MNEILDYQYTEDEDGFRKYMHLERYGTTEVNGIELGPEVYIFPKIDGTNASVWFNGEEVQAGSRNRHLTETGKLDNAGFLGWVQENEAIKSMTAAHPDYIFYGEWLVPHSFKQYRADAWRDFYVFDVYDRATDNYIHYQDYQKIVEEFNVNYLAPLDVVKNPDYERLLKHLERNRYLVSDDSDKPGEGIVIKNYGYANKYGRTVWAKMVTSSFKEQNAKTFGHGVAAEAKDMVEQTIADQYVTQELCDKVHAKIVNEDGEFSNRDIPRYLNTVYYDLIREESWAFIKGNKNPTINYKTLHTLVLLKAKEFRPEVFGHTISRPA